MQRTTHRAEPSTRPPRLPASRIASAAALFALALTALGCRSTAGQPAGLEDVRLVSVPDGGTLTFDGLVDRLHGHDVIVLGELHDSGPGHRAQWHLTEALLARAGGGSVALEMLERDVQDVVDAWLDGRIDTKTFLAQARPWSNHIEHYHPVLELARERGYAVIAANAPAFLARRVAREGPRALSQSSFGSFALELDDAPYRGRFEVAMGFHQPAGAGHGHHMDTAMLERFFAAQVLRDESMAEAIDLFLARRPDGLPVVLWCGRFHSDYGLGAVERLARLRPDLSIAVVSMARADTEELLAAEPPVGIAIVSVP